MLCKEGKIEASGNVLEVNHHDFRFMLVVYFLQSDTWKNEELVWIRLYGLSFLVALKQKNK